MNSKMSTGAIFISSPHPNLQQKAGFSLKLKNEAHYPTVTVFIVT